MNTKNLVAQLYIVTLVGLALSPSVILAFNDPTRPYQFKDKPEIIEVEISNNSEDWKLNGIQIRGQQRSAIINGYHVKEGQLIGTATVKGITPAFVVLEKNNQRLIIHLFETQVKKNSEVKKDNAQSGPME